jgi:hypothetical protein
MSIFKGDSEYEYGDASFSFTGGTLEAQTVTIPLVNDGGGLTPLRYGEQNGYLYLTGDPNSYIQTVNGTLKVYLSTENGYTSLDELQVYNYCKLGGTFYGKLVNGRPTYRYTEYDLLSANPLELDANDPNRGFCFFTGNLPATSYGAGPDPNGEHYAEQYCGYKSGNTYWLIFMGFTKGDCNGDNAVDISDLTILGTNWNQTGQTWAEGDFNGDTTVDISDLTIMGSTWGWTADPNDIIDDSMQAGSGGSLCPPLVDRDGDGDFDIDDVHIILDEAANGGDQQSSRIGKPGEGLQSVLAIGCCLMPLCLVRFRRR